MISCMRIQLVLFVQAALSGLSRGGEHFFVTGANRQVNEFGPNFGTSVTAVTIWDEVSKKELAFVRNRPKLRLSPRPGPGSSGQPASGSPSTPGVGGPLLRFSGPYLFPKSACHSYGLTAGFSAVNNPWARSQISSRLGHWSRAASPLPRPVPCGPLAKMCASTGTPALTSAS